MVIETAEKRGIFGTGYHASQATLAPKGYLTGAEWNWAKVYTDYIEKHQEGQALASTSCAAASRRASSRCPPYGAAVSDGGQDEGRRGQGQAHRRHARDLQGPAQGQRRQGGHRRPGVEQAQTDIELEKMNYLVEGVKGSIE